MKLAVIPARGGSRRIPRKNIKSFNGKPIIAWSIQAAQDAEVFDRIIVSTDDLEIASIAKNYGAEVPFIRPDNLSDDYTGTIPVIAHAIEWHKIRGIHPTQTCCIYATAPFLRGADIRKGAELLDQTGADYAFSVTSYAFPIQRAIKLREDGRVEMFNSENFEARSQDLTDAYHDAAQFYWGRTQSWLSQKAMFASGSVPVVLPRHRVQDIDTMDDWQHAEILMQALKISQDDVGF